MPIWVSIRSSAEVFKKDMLKLKYYMKLTLLVHRQFRKYQEYQSITQKNGKL